MVLENTPQPFNEDVILQAPVGGAIHANGDLVVLENACEAFAHQN
jgi:hypothetical protein